jgi:hypothetical protein
MYQSRASERLLYALCWACTVLVASGADATTAPPLLPPKDEQAQPPAWVADGGWIAWIVIVCMMFW